jgi:SAM-dependent methyltransferase
MPLYAVTIFVSAFLLFLVQPILAKQILPWFGGTAAVWTMCMVFFQFVLLLGYAYSHWLASTFSPKRQATIHLALLVLSLAFLPIIPDASWKPTGLEDPGLRILLLLFATIGLPYMLLATTSPLVQAWFARAYPGSSPYRLFALSNFASMLALLGYPFLLEPAFPTRLQSLGWSAGYVLFVLVCGLLAWTSRSIEAGTPAPQADGTTGESRANPSARDLLLWLVLSALGSVMLLGVSNHLTQNISSIPLLWVVPLAVYLLTFILCFEGSGWYKRDAYLAFLVSALGVMGWFLADKRLHFELYWNVAAFIAGLFFACMFCHGELARMRPGARHLTLFYLMVSLGGVIGGVLVGIVAPLTLPGYLELEIALVVIAFLALYLNNQRHPAIVTMLAATLLFTLGALLYRIEKFTENAVLIERNFYGVLRVKEQHSRDGDPESRYRSLVHGAILHGEQWLAPKFSKAATTYYKTTSGIGLTLLALEGRPIRVGIIGLGAGTIAAYGDGDDVYRFYDINPAVERIARKEFKFLSESDAKIEVVIGDARLNLEREKPQEFDVLAVDAFSSDSIPVHLITVEAVEVYLKHLKADGVIAFHTSNRFLDLKPVLLQIAQKLGLEYAFLHEDDSDGGTTSDWVLLTRNKSILARKEIVAITQPVAPQPGWRLWTDDYNNLLQVLRE